MRCREGGEAGTAGERVETCGEIAKGKVMVGRTDFIFFFLSLFECFPSPIFMNERINVPPVEH